MSVLLPVLLSIYETLLVRRSGDRLNILFPSPLGMARGIFLFGFSWVLFCLFVCCLLIYLKHLHEESKVDLIVRFIQSAVAVIRGKGRPFVIFALSVGFSF